MKQDLISIIIPVYNVENYVAKCIESVIQQTYQNLEIIIIDDGSTDNGYQICEQYAKEDKRITLIHQENGGLSYTRNKGIKLAKGRYIGFVDSDDVISPHMYEFLHRALIQDKSKISICNCVCFDNDEPIFDLKYQSKKLTTLESLEELLIDKKITNHAVDKLYSKELFEEINFPLSRKYEDIFTTYKLFLKTETISYLECNLYGYYQRVGSITGEYNKNTTKDFIAAINERYNKLYNYHQDLNPYLDMNKVNSVLRYFLDIVRFKRIDVLKDKEYKSLLYNELKIAKQIYTKPVRQLNTFKKNLLIKLLFLNPYLFYYVTSVYFNIDKKQR